MTADEVQALILKIQYLDRKRPRAAALVVQLVDQFLDGPEPLEPVNDDMEGRADGQRL